MRIFLLLTFLFSGWVFAESKEESLVYIPQGQMRGNPIKVYVSNVDLRKDQNPVLQAYSSNSSTSPIIVELVPAEVIVESKFTSPDKVPRSGTLLLFDFNQKDSYEALSGGKFSKWVSGVRFFPIVKWGPDKESSAAGAEGQSVLIGDLKTSGTSVLVVTVILAGIILVLSYRNKGSALAVLKSKEGSYSLSKAQLLAWTLAATFCVGVFGMAQQILPDIPTTLIALLGLSVLTTGSAYAVPAVKGEEDKAATKKVAGKSDAEASAVSRSVILDLISINEGDGKEPQLSIAKVQMLLWTVISLILFVSKSLLGGSLWDIPWELVVLMGVSQTSYVVPKYWNRGANANPAPADQ